MNEATVPALVYLGPALLPLAFAAALILPWLRRRALWLTPLAALPALIAALAAPLAQVDLPWLLLGARFGLDETGRLFLLFTSLLWLASAVYACGYLARDERRVAFSAFYLAAMAGNFGLILAQDMASFYVFFALMSFASYGLVVHNRDSDALYAGRIYIALVVAGELALFAAVVMIADAAQSLYFANIAAATMEAPARDAIVALVLVGFGIKAGAIPLHVWLPLAHPAAPTPASAVLSGAMIKAGLLGWVRFLPLGAALPAWADAMLLFGLLAAFLGAFAGALQRNPKAALAYSSISQMGFITVAVGLALAQPAAAPAAVLAASLYAFHHGFAKAALFLGVGMSAVRGAAARMIVACGLLLPALALVGFPLTSGAGAKAELKALVGAAAAWPILPLLLSLAAAGTTLVMARVLYLVWPRGEAAHGDAPGAGLWAGWSTLVLASLVALWLLPQAQEIDAKPFGSADALWPIALGAVLAAGAYGLRGSMRWTLPPGDLLVPLARLANAARSHVAGRPSNRGLRRRPVGVRLGLAWLARRSARIEAALARSAVAGPILLACAILILGLAAS